MLVSTQNQEDRAVIKSQELSVAIWRRFVGDFSGAQTEDRDTLTILWANTPFPFWNVIFFSDDVCSVEQLKAAANEAASIASTKKHPGMISVCTSLLDKTASEQTDSILSMAGYPISVPITGMTAEPFPITATCPTNLKIERVNDFRILTELNCRAYDVPVEAAKTSTLSEELAQHAFIYLGYEESRPVCTAAVIVQQDVLYLALVATDEKARNKGYGGAIVRHALQQAHEATGLTQAALHATTAGEPVYAKIGFQPVAEFRWYMQEHQ